MNKDTKIYLILVVIVLLIISGIYGYKYMTKEDPQDKLMRCIAANTTLYTSTGCSHCENQKAILGSSLSYFKNIDCLTTPEICNEAGVHSYPTWIINGKSYVGVQTITKLTEIAGCQDCSINTNDTTINDTGTCNGTDTCIQAVSNTCKPAGATK